MKTFNLTEEQKLYWKRLQEKNIYRLQAVIKKLALEVIAEQADKTKIIIPGTSTILAVFPNKDFKTKEAFIQYHQANGRWADDVVLYPLLQKLGYQPVIHLPGTLSGIPPYLPFTQANTGLRIDLVNHGAISGGYHWQLKGMHTPGDGNCGYHAIAQQVLKDLSAIHQSNPEIKINTVQEVTQEFNRLEQIAEQRYLNAYAILEKMDLKTLQKIYAYAINNLVEEDTYLKNRPDHFVKENEFKNIKREDFFSIKEQVVHALAREAWRNPEAYNVLLNHQTNFANPINSSQIANLKYCGFHSHDEMAEESPAGVHELLATLKG